MNKSDISKAIIPFSGNIATLLYPGILFSTIIIAIWQKKIPKELSPINLNNDENLFIYKSLCINLNTYIHITKPLAIADNFNCVPQFITPFK